MGQSHHLGPRLDLRLRDDDMAEWVIVCHAVLWIAHARGMKYAGDSLRLRRLYSGVIALALAFVALLITSASMNGWVVARYVAGSGLPATSWTDPVFGHPLGFYFFELPSTPASSPSSRLWPSPRVALAYYLAARGWQVAAVSRHMAASGRLDFSTVCARI